MTEQKTKQKTKAQAALDHLNEAWAYYTPVPRPVQDAPYYDDLPVAA